MATSLCALLCTCLQKGRYFAQVSGVTWAFSLDIFVTPSCALNRGIYSAPLRLARSLRAGAQTRCRLPSDGHLSDSAKSNTDLPHTLPATTNFVTKNAYALSATFVAFAPAFAPADFRDTAASISGTREFCVLEQRFARIWASCSPIVTPK
jgi:hypothetical protein